jgi:outer membrane protein assembly factor BamB
MRPPENVVPSGAARQISLICTATVLLAGFCLGQIASSASPSGGLPTAKVLTSWTEFHFRHNGTRLNPYEKVLNVSNVGNLRLKWSNQTGVVESSSPAVVNGVVYIGTTDYNLQALSARTGAKLWSYETRDIINSSPAVANGVVYFGSDDYNVYALNARTGDKLWSYATGNSVGSPTVVNGVVYVGSYDQNVYALNARTGDKLWSYKTGSYVDASPVVVNGMVYIGSYDNNVYAFGLKHGPK